MNTSAAQHAGTVGETQVDAVLAYLGRLTGEAVEEGTLLKLRSVHRAALTSWAAKQGIQLNSFVMKAGNCTVTQILGLDQAELPQPVSSVEVTLQAPRSSGDAPLGEIGIDLEEVDSLPDAIDFRIHPFFQDHFTPAELAYCIRQKDSRVSLCGLWAAKEAILKAGLIPLSTSKMSGFEISHDEAGRPAFPGCRLSISHTSKYAVAVCIASSPDIPKTAVEEAIPSAKAVIVDAPRRRWRWLRT